MVQYYVMTFSCLQIPREIFKILMTTSAYMYIYIYIIHIILNNYSHEKKTKASTATKKLDR